MQLSENNQKFGLTSNILKIIAIIAMTVDHVAWAIFPGFSTNIVAILMHVIGRIAC
ncbi:MAG: conjugal transfer protein TraX, partial [Clostridia bacterium]|nr:conjugal transfer protein TraX [Clostridia bacterium]